MAATLTNLMSQHKRMQHQLVLDIRPAIFFSNPWLRRRTSGTCCRTSNRSGETGQVARIPWNPKHGRQAVIFFGGITQYMLQMVTLQNQQLEEQPAVTVLPRLVTKVLPVDVCYQSTRYRGGSDWCHPPFEN